jgi:hypothetical protein
MSVSKTKYSETHVPSDVRDDVNIPAQRIPSPEGKRTTYKSPSKSSIDTPLHSSSATSDHSQATKRIADTNTSSISILKPSMVSRLPVTAPYQPLPTGARLEQLPRSIPLPLSAGIVPSAQHYPSSYPVLKCYPIPPNLPVAFGQPVTNTRQSISLANMDDDPSAKPRKVGEGSSSATTLPSEQTAELPFWHESRLEPDENRPFFWDYPDPEFLDRANEGGELSLERISSLANEDGEALLDIFFNDDSSAGKPESLYGPRPDDSQFAKRIADANASSTAILAPSMVIGLPIAGPNQPLPMDAPLDFRQPASDDRPLVNLPDMVDDRPAKRRRVCKRSDSTTIHPPEQTAALPIWHESKIVPEEDPTPYMAFLGLMDKKGKNFVKKIFNCKKNFRGDRVDFLKKLFMHLSEAIEKRRDGTNQISDDQLGKLIVASFVLTIKISKHFDKNTKKTYSVRDIATLVIKFINKNHCVIPYLKGGLQLGSETSYFLFGGKTKAELMLWCAEQNVSLNQEELEFLQKHRFKVEISGGRYLLKELRARVKEQQKNATS